MDKVVFNESVSSSHQIGVSVYFLLRESSVSEMWNRIQTSKWPTCKCEHKADIALYNHTVGIDNHSGLPVSNDLTKQRSPSGTQDLNEHGVVDFSQGEEKQCVLSPNKELMADQRHNSKSL